MIALALALVLSQTQPTAEELAGARNAIASAIDGYRAGTRTYTFTSGRTRICVKFAGAASAPAGSVTLRFGATILTPSLLASLGIPAAPKDEYAGLDVQGVPAQSYTFNPQSTFALWDVLDSAAAKIANPIDATCEVLIVRATDSAIATWLPCACRAGNPCSWDPDGAGPLPAQTAPNGSTFDPGTWTGNGCRPKSCVTRFDGNGIDNSWPAECPK